MALSQARLGASQAGGYDFQFVDPPDDSLQCPVCLLPFRDPHLLSCCGHKICDSCIRPIKTARRPCPICRQSVFQSMLDQSYKRKVESLRLYCSKKSEGCDWEGSLRHLDAHLKNDCSYVKAECWYQCGGHYQRRLLPKHEIEDCPKLPAEVIISKLEDTITRLSRGNGQIESDFKTKVHPQIVRLKASLRIAEKDHREQQEKSEAVISKLKEVNARLTKGSAPHEFARDREVKQIQAAHKQQLQKQTSDYEAKFRTMTASHAQETAKLKSSLQTAEKCHREDQAKLSKSNETITLLREDKVQLKLAHDRELKQMQVTHKQQLQEQTSNYEARLQAEIATHAQETARLMVLLQTAEVRYQEDMAKLDSIRTCQIQKDEGLIALQKQNAELSIKNRYLEHSLEQQQSRIVYTIPEHRLEQQQSRITHTIPQQTRAQTKEEFICKYCGRVCKARIGLWSHENAHERRGDTCRW